MSALAHRHAATEHRTDYAICKELLREAVAAPLYIGQGPHRTNFELCVRVPSMRGKAVLVAVGLKAGWRGRYKVKSFYMVTEERITDRRLKGYSILSPRYRRKAA